MVRADCSMRDMGNEVNSPTNRRKMEVAVKRQLAGNSGGCSSET